MDVAQVLSLPQDLRYRAAIDAFGGDIARFVAGYEHDPGRRPELLQDVHLALWQSLATFAGQCSLRTWIYRVAHNVCVTHVQKSLRVLERRAVALEDMDEPDDGRDAIARTERRIDLARVLAVVHSLPAIDRQIVLLYLEDLDAAAIAEVTGISPGNVATRIHRLKALLARRLDSTENHHGRK